MKKCLRIILTAQFPEELLISFIQKGAKKLSLEGTAQIIDRTAKTVRITACGSADALDDFIDLLYKGTKGFDLEDIEIEPFLKDKDYRAVFRILE